MASQELQAVRHVADALLDLSGAPLTPGGAAGQQAEGHGSDKDGDHADEPAGAHPLQVADAQHLRPAANNEGEDAHREGGLNRSDDDGVRADHRRDRGAQPIGEVLGHTVRGVQQRLDAELDAVEKAATTMPQ